MADKFSKKVAIKNLGQAANEHASAVEQLTKTVYSLMQKVYQLENAQNTSVRVQNQLDYRTRAIASLLEGQGVTETAVKAEVFKLQVVQFDFDSARDDEVRFLVEANDREAATGLTAITTARAYLAGVEVESNRIVRSKTEIGKQELLPEIDAELIGMKVGESKRFPLNLQGKTDEVEITLLGLRAQTATQAV